jgi:fanconi-associated nuclease 1
MVRRAELGLCDGRCIRDHRGMFPRPPLIQCIGASNLSQICRLFSEEYGHRTGGMPDLCLWKHTNTEKRCMFSEVKGPGDRLSETQENWIDFLAGLGGTLEVELCRVHEVDKDGKAVVPRSNNAGSQKEGRPGNKRKAS